MLQDVWLRRHETADAFQMSVRPLRKNQPLLINRETFLSLAQQYFWFC